MGSNDENFENNLDSTLNMSLDEIERMLNGQSQFDADVPEYETADLESLLSELESMDDDGDIQEISDLLDKAENNEAADQGIVDLLNLQDDIDEVTAYDAMDLFSGESEKKPKESFLKRILAKFKKNPKQQETTSSELSELLEGAETVEEQPKAKKPKEKKVKEKKPKKDKKSKEKEQTEQVVTQSESEELQPGKPEWDSLEVFQDDSLNGSDAIILELEKDEVLKEEENIKEKPKKKEKANKKDKAKKKASKKGDEEGEDSENSDKKKPKEKKVKEKKVKVKKVKEKGPVLYDYDEEPLTKKKVGIVFFVCIMLMLAILALIINFAGHRNRKLAEEAYEAGDYLQCYQLLYGQHLSEGQEVLYHKSKINLQMDLVWKRYDDFIRDKDYLKGLDKLIQFVAGYPELSTYAAEWNCEKVVADTYNGVLSVLYEEYKLDAQDAMDIANISDDVEYTKALKELAEKKEKGMLKYPHMLEEEEERAIDFD